MAKRILILAGILTCIAVAVFFIVPRGKQDASSVEKEITLLVKEFDNAIYFRDDRKRALAAAQAIVDIADRSSNPKGTKARGIIRLAYANIGMGKWDPDWRNKVKQCAELISDEPTVERAEFLLYYGHLMGKWGKHEFEAGLQKAQEALWIANHVKDDRTVALAYVISTELQMFLGRSDLVAMNAYRGLSVANHYGEKSIRVVALRNLLTDMLYLERDAEAAEVGEMLYKMVPDSTEAMYTMFVNRKSEKLEEYVQKRVEGFNNLPPDDAEGRRLARSRLGVLLERLGRAYLARKEMANARETLQQALTHLRIINDQVSMSSCMSGLQIANLELADDVASVDKVVKEFHGDKNTVLFAEAVAAAYTRLGEREKSLQWRERALIVQTKAQRNGVSHLRQSSNLYWESELSLRKEAELNSRIAKESQMRTWFLSSALVLGLICALLGGFYYLLRQKSNSLEVLVKERTGSLSKAVEKAHAADRAKSDFLAQINHEIRNPLTAILGYCELLSFDETKSEQYVSGIEASSIHLRELVDRILEVSKIESTGLEAQLVEFFPKKTVSDIHGIMADQASKRGLDFQCTFKGDPASLVLSDETKVRQIVLNLIGNAFKFTEKGGVNASFELLPKPKDSQAEIVIDVVDTGIGIAEGQLDAVFERFTKASNASTREGSGLGLFITQRLVDCLGGSVTLKSSLGVGTQVRVTLPVEIASGLPDSRPKAKANAVLTPKSSNYSATRVLVVDDKEVIRNTLRLQLKEHGLDCKTEYGLERTIEVIESWCPDLVLLDLRMPEHSGYEVLEQIRKSQSSSVAVYAMTGDATVPVQQQCLSVGFDGFITKPFKIASVLEILKTIESVA